MYEMKPEYYIGCAQIYEEHKKLFEMAEETYQLLHEEYIPDKYDNIKDILQELKEYTSYHFGHEEEYMASIHYKRIGSQKIQHKAFLQKLDEMNLDDMMEDEQEKAIEGLLNLFTDWLKYHILDNDRLIVNDP